MGLLPTLPGGIATPPVIHTGQYGNADRNLSSSGPSPVANTVYYQGITIPFDYNARSLLWANGNASTTRDVCFGLYSNDGVLIYDSGVVGFTSPATGQKHSITPTSPWFVPAGTYYFAFQTSSTAAIHCWDSVLSPDTALLYETRGSMGLPSTMVNATAGGDHLAPVIALTRT
jgi:hypothetical protein